MMNGDGEVIRSCDQDACFRGKMGFGCSEFGRVPLDSAHGLQQLVAPTQPGLGASVILTMSA